MGAGVEIASTFSSVSSQGMTGMQVLSSIYSCLRKRGLLPL